MNLGKAIKKLRKEKGYNLNEMAKQVNCSPSYLSQLENNRVNFIKSKYVESFCEVIGIPIALIYLMALEVNDAPVENRLEAKVILEELNQTYLDIFIKK